VGACTRGRAYLNLPKVAKALHHGVLGSLQIEMPYDSHIFMYTIYKKGNIKKETIAVSNH